MKPGCISILVPNAVFFFSCPMQPILYWTFAVLSQHNIINNAEKHVGHSTKAISVSKKIQ